MSTGELTPLAMDPLLTNFSTTLETDSTRMSTLEPTRELTLIASLLTTSATTLTAVDIPSPSK
jgi:hypothetical protein